MPASVGRVEALDCALMPELSPAQPDADLRFAHYRVERSPDGSPWKLGSGAMGVTYKAFDERLRIEVALKVITPAQVDEAKAQALFLREARAAARVRHPNVASVVFLNDTPGKFFYAMEFIAGESLADWLRTRGALPPEMAIGFAIQIARGLGAIHHQQIVHRDLKPANLMIVAAEGSKTHVGADSDPEAWQIKIIDFGLARGFGGGGLGTEADAQTIGFRGTALYASPEQCEERGQIDGRSDLYALGCILWEMLVGAPPFRARTHRELLNQHVSLPPPLERIGYLPSGLRSVLTRLLAKDSGDRFDNADAVVKALESCREQPPQDGAKIDPVAETTHDVAAVPAFASAPPPPPPARTAQPRTVGIALAVAAVALLLTGAAWFFTRGQSASTLSSAVAPAPVVAAGAPTAVPSPAPTPIALSRKAVAVLPFENLSGRPEDAYLADGLQEEILNALARLRDLKVISRTSVKEYRGKDLNIRKIGERLGVGTIVEGSVRRDGDTLRLTIQVIDARDDSHLLATSYDRELNKVLELQSAVARQVADALAATLTRQERGNLDRVATNNGDAYDRYLRAVALFRQPAPDDPEGLIVPKRLLEEAVRLDPNYADAYAMLSLANIWSFMLIGERPEFATAAKQYLDRTYALDPQSPDAQLARGLYALYISKNRDEAMVDLASALKSRPNSAEFHQAYGLVLRRAGRMDEALEHLVRAWDLDPLNQAYDGPGIITLIGLRRYPEAIKHAELDHARFPGGADSYLVRARLEARLRNSSEPMRAALRDHGNEFDPRTRTWFEAEIAQAEGRYLDAIKLQEGLPVEDALWRSLWIGSLYYAAGDPARAEENFRRAEAAGLDGAKRSTLSDYELPLAVVQSMLGQHATALETVERVRARNPESRDAVNGPAASFVRSFVLVRAGRTEEGYAEVARLLRVPFGDNAGYLFFGPRDPISLLTLGDPRFDELINHPPRL